MVRRTRLRLGDVTLHDCGGHRQQCSRSVSWNTTGSWLALASNDRLAKIWTVEGGSSQGREVTVISGHGAPVDRVRFHPTEPTWLCTTAQDRTIRLWDVRSPSSQMSNRAVGRIEIQSSSRYGSCPASVEWCASPSNGKDSSVYLVVTERDDSVHIYDVRKLMGSGRGASLQGNNNAPVRSFRLHPQMVETCQFSPSGTYLVAATSLRGEGMGGIRIWPWEKQGAPEEKNFHLYNGHTGPIYSHVFSPDGKRLATGGSDAIVGLWDVASMVCTHAITRHAQFIRSCAFSHDSKLLASSSEEDGIDLADASNGDLVGNVSLSSGGGTGRNRGGADEIAFHPKGYVLACARGDLMGGVSPVTVAKISVSSQ